MREMTSAAAAAVSAPIVSLGFFIELEFEEGFLRFWTGICPIEWDGKTWVGAGAILKLSLPEETKELESKSVVVELQATQDLVNIALDNDDGYQGYPARIWLGQMRLWTDPGYQLLLDNDELQILDNDGNVIMTQNQPAIEDNEGEYLLDNDGNPIFDNTNIQLYTDIIADPVRWCKGTMDQMPILDDPNRPVIRLFIETDALLLNLVKERRYTHEDQQTDFEGDKFFEFVADLQDKEIILE